MNSDGTAKRWGGLVANVYEEKVSVNPSAPPALDNPTTVGTHVKPGPITRNDLFHFIPIGPRVGKASRVVPNQIDNSSTSSAPLRARYASTWLFY